MSRIYIKFYNQFLFENKSIFQKDYAGILPYSPITKKFLLNLRSEEVNNPNLYSSWGGGIEFDETPKTAATREFKEESGFIEELGKLLKLNVSVKEKGNTRKKYHLFIVMIGADFKPILDSESKSFRWVSFDELYSMPKELFHPEFYKSLKDIKSKLNYIINI